MEDEPILPVAHVGGDIFLAYNLISDVSRSLSFALDDGVERKLREFRTLVDSLVDERALVPEKKHFRIFEDLLREENIQRQILDLRRSSSLRAIVVIVKQPFQKVYDAKNRRDEMVFRVKIIDKRPETRGGTRVSATFVEAEGFEEETFNREIGLRKLADARFEAVADDRGNATVVISGLKDGSFLKPLSVKFSAFSAEGVPVASSELSNPFIVASNGSAQWKKAAGILLENYLFSEGVSVSIEKFRNVVQLHYLTVTGQDIGAPKRPLSVRELEFFFEDSSRIDRGKFDGFWSWWGPILEKIVGKVNDRRIRDMWMDGTVFGFATRPEAESVLADQNEGTFLLRWSVKNAGMICISYLSATVKHVLVPETSPVATYLSVGGAASLSSIVRLKFSERLEDRGNIACVVEDKNIALEPHWKDFNPKRKRIIEYADRYEPEVKIARANLDVLDLDLDFLSDPFEFD